MIYVCACVCDHKKLPGIKARKQNKIGVRVFYRVNFALPGVLNKECRLYWIKIIFVAAKVLIKVVATLFDLCFFVLAKFPIRSKVA
jgi:hypothetical protein